MLHKKFQNHSRFLSGKEELKICAIYGHGGHVGKVTKTS